MGTHYIHAPQVTNGETPADVIRKALNPAHLEEGIGERISDSTLIPISYRDTHRDAVFAALKEHGLFPSNSEE